jgi:enoyl-CoA hydratase
MDADHPPADPGAGRTVRIDEPSPGVRVITLDRPQRLNAMSGGLINDLHQALDDAAADEAGRVVVIAAVNGPASGGGLALALAADIRVAAASATFNAAFVRIGLSGCDIGVSWLLPRLIGAGRSHELLLTGRLVDAAEADRIGLVNRVVPDGEVLAAALARRPRSRRTARWASG